MTRRAEPMSKLTRAGKEHQMTGTGEGKGRGKSAKDKNTCLSLIPTLDGIPYLLKLASVFLFKTEAV